MKVRISLNADLGEGYGAYSIGEDDALLDLMTDVNIHGGDPSIMRKRVLESHHRGLGIGAHVCYPDLRGFGRRAVELNPSEIRDDVGYQIGALAGVCASTGATLKHVKAHGALYKARCIKRHPKWRRSRKPLPTPFNPSTKVCL